MAPSTTSSPTSDRCPACSAPAAGKFCASCGAALSGAVCAGCRTPLTPGARFCHRCGTPAGAPGSERGLAAILPWAVAGIALLALIALVAGQRFARGPQTEPVDPPVAEAPVAGPMGGGGAMPDIASMSPEERADRLFNRIMIYSEGGKPDSAKFFAPMALAAYEMVAPLDADQHYHVGRIGIAIDSVALATAEADSILEQSPNHLLGLLLAGEAAARRGDAKAAAAFHQRFVAAYKNEVARKLPEYEQHAQEIDAALKG